jgi:hypothetical protein
MKTLTRFSVITLSIFLIFLAGCGYNESKVRETTDIVDKIISVNDELDSRNAQLKSTKDPEIKSELEKNISLNEQLHDLYLKDFQFAFADLSQKERDKVDEYIAIYYNGDASELLE